MPMKRNLTNELAADLAALKRGTPLRETVFTSNADGTVNRTVTLGSEQTQTVLSGPRWEVLTARHALNYSQNEFAELLGVSKRTLENWEQGRSTPSGAAQALITVARIKPKAVRDALKAARAA
jgi:putative transcriptional regulator